MSKKRIRWLNLLSGLLCQGLIAGYGLILPNLILTVYGSVLNGLLATVTQILAYLSLVEMGLYSAAVVSLYKPLTERDYSTASSILVAIDNFYRRIAILFTIGILVCAFIVPQIIKDDVPLTTILLVLISLSGINLFNYLCLAKYKIVLQAADKLYIINSVHCVGVVIQFFLSILVVFNGVNVACVKAVIIIANIVEWLFFVCYFKKYLSKLSLNAEPNNSAIRQRKDILVHHISALVLNNTDVVLLTVFMPSLTYVSVYSIYAMVLILVQNVVTTLTGVYASQIGQFYSTKNFYQLYNVIKKYEIFYYLVLFSCFSIMDVLIMPFVSIFTRDVNDAEYYIPIIGVLFSIYGITRMFRAPFSTLTGAAGRFKETRLQSLIEAGINLVLSVSLVPIYGIVGVLIGSITGEVYRTIHTVVYCHKEILPICWTRSVCFCILNSGLFLLVHFLMCSFRIYKPLSYLDLFYLIMEVSLVLFTLYSLLNFVLYKATLRSFEKVNDLQNDKNDISNN